MTPLFPHIQFLISDNHHSDWQIILAEKYNDWVYFMPKRALKKYGWKLHISAILEDAIDILRVSLPLLLAENVAFKFPHTIEFLAQLNAGENQDCQAGKFITVYPDNSKQAVRLAKKLHRLTQTYRGPRILSDERWQENSLIHYRWGAFIFHVQQSLYGEIMPVVKRGKKIIPDKRMPFYIKPEMKDPFKKKPRESLYQVLNRRYLTAHLITRSLGCDVYLALDLYKKRRCIIKSSARYSLIDQYGRDSVHRLKAEALILNQLAENKAIPQFYDAFHDEHDCFHLVMEDISGETLEAQIAERQCSGELPGQIEILNLAQQLGEILCEIHQKKIIHADLKLQNILISPTQEIYLIDFNTAYVLNSKERRLGGGTIGYRSPQMSENKKPSVSDDIYGLGAVLLYYATLGIPHKTGDLTRKPLSLVAKINPQISASLMNIIGCCLEPTAHDRFDSAASFLSALKECKTDRVQDRVKKINNKISQRNLIRTAKALGCYLIDNYYNPTVVGTGFATPVINGIALHDFRGTAACVLALSKLLNQEHDFRIKDVLEKAALSLSNIKRLPYNRIPGLYVGESGVALSLLNAGRALSNQTIIDAAIQQFRSIAACSHESPDLFNGSAGRLRTALLFWQYTQDEHDFSIAKAAAESLAQAAIFLTPQECCWGLPGFDSFPSQISSNNDIKQFGYAHGAAGIADALIDYYIYTKSLEIKKLILAAIQWLLKHARYSNKSQYETLDWPMAPGEEPTAAFWCHGSTGIGKLFMRAAQVNLYPPGLLIAEQSANSIAKITWASPGQCHGLAGNIEFLVSLWQYTRKKRHYQYLCRLLDLFNFWCEEIHQLPWGINTIEPRELMSGIPGLILCYLGIVKGLSKTRGASVGHQDLF